VLAVAVALILNALRDATPHLVRTRRLGWPPWSRPTRLRANRA